MEEVAYHSEKIPCKEYESSLSNDFLKGLFLISSCTDIFDEDGSLSGSSLGSLVKEAYYSLGLNSESKIVINRKGNFCDASYKEVWDCYRSITGKEDFDPAYKPTTKKELAKEFQRRNRLARDNSQNNYYLTAGDSYMNKLSFNFMNSKNPLERKKNLGNVLWGVLRTSTFLERLGGDFPYDFFEESESED